ncbi:GtrA family protein, partial [Candidatus Dojkabacteria bacterium]|nr:GtrA family protein [Candidatus Dojkabacteria bacterium]
VLGVMDADLSHPPARLPRLFVAIGAGADIAIGSRYIRGGKIVGWGFKRKLMSDVATLLAHLFTDVHDPMTGYFLVRRETLDGVTLDPQGFKLLLEVLIKARYQQVVEIPITFTNRTAGKSKAGIGETFAYLANLMRYLPYKRSVIMQFGKFALVGASGTLLNLAIVYLLTSRLEMHYILSAVIAFIVAMSSNFILNSLWTFRGSLERRAGTRYLQFALVSVLTLVINLLVLAFLTEILGLYYLLSQLIGIGIGLIFNFVGNKVWTYAR